MSVLLSAMLMASVASISGMIHPRPVGIAVSQYTYQFASLEECNNFKGKLKEFTINVPKELTQGGAFVLGNCEEVK